MTTRNPAHKKRQMAQNVKRGRKPMPGESTTMPGGKRPPSMPRKPIPKTRKY